MLYRASVVELKSLIYWTKNNLWYHNKAKTIETKKYIYLPSSFLHILQVHPQIVLVLDGSEI